MLIAFEAEAAALYCTEWKLDWIQETVTLDEPNAHYVLVDLGGNLYVFSFLKPRGPIGTEFISHLQSIRGMTDKN